MCGSADGHECKLANSNSHAYSYSYSYSYTDPYVNPYSDAYSNTYTYSNSDRDGSAYAHGIRTASYKRGSAD